MKRIPHATHVDGGNPLFPDTGQVCCWGVAVYGPSRCTCWEPVYDLAQAQLVRSEPVTRLAMCDDCAYRPGSPERAGTNGAHDQDDLDQLVVTRSPFACHQGIRRVVEWRHPSGMTVPGDPAAYQPVMVGGHPHKADGTPADLCAGWAARAKTRR